VSASQERINAKGRDYSQQQSPQQYRIMPTNCRVPVYIVQQNTTYYNAGFIVVGAITIGPIRGRSDGRQYPSSMLRIVFRKLRQCVCNFCKSGIHSDKQRHQFCVLFSVGRKRGENDWHIGYRKKCTLYRAVLSPHETLENSHFTIFFSSGAIWWYVHWFCGRCMTFLDPAKLWRRLRCRPCHCIVFDGILNY